MSDEHDARVCLCEACANLRWELEQQLQNTYQLIRMLQVVEDAIDAGRAAKRKERLH